jgi:hypothetical protein
MELSDAPEKKSPVTGDRSRNPATNSAVNFFKVCATILNKFIERLKLYTKKFDSYTLDMDDSNGVTDTTQLIFCRGINSAFHIHEELASVCRLNTPKTGQDM